MDFLTEQKEIERIINESKKSVFLLKYFSELEKIIDKYEKINLKYFKAVEKMANIIATISNKDLERRYKKNIKIIEKNTKNLKKNSSEIFNNIIASYESLNESKSKVVFYEIKKSIKKMIPGAIAAVVGNLLGFGVFGVPISVAIGYLINRGENKWINDIDKHFDYHRNEMVYFYKTIKKLYRNLKNKPETNKNILMKVEKQIVNLEKNIKVIKEQSALSLELALHLKHNYKKYLKGK